MANVAPNMVERTGADERPLPGTNAKPIPATAGAGKPETAAARTAVGALTAVRLARRAARSGVARTASATGTPTKTTPSVARPSPSTVQSNAMPGIG